MHGRRNRRNMTYLTIMVFVGGRALAMADEGEVAGQLEAEVPEQGEIAELAQAAMPGGWLERDDIISEVGLKGLASLVLEDVGGEIAEDDRLMMRRERFFEVEMECRACFAPARQ